MCLYWIVIWSQLFCVSYYYSYSRKKRFSIEILVSTLRARTCTQKFIRNFVLFSALLGIDSIMSPSQILDYFLFFVQCKLPLECHEFQFKNKHAIVRVQRFSRPPLIIILQQDRILGNLKEKNLGWNTSPWISNIPRRKSGKGQQEIWLERLVYNIFFLRCCAGKRSQEGG